MYWLDVDLVVDPSLHEKLSELSPCPEKIVMDYQTMGQVNREIFDEINQGRHQSYSSTKLVAHLMDKKGNMFLIMFGMVLINLFMICL